MLSRISMGSIVLAALWAPIALAQDAKNIPTGKASGRGTAGSHLGHDQAPGPRQQAPLTPEYRAISRPT